MDEFAWIAQYFAPLSGEGALGLKDDAAILAPAPGKELVITSDALVEGRHFLPAMMPEKLAHKALAVNLSDLAAMGAAPRGYTLAIGLTHQVNADWTAAFTAGLAKMQRAYGIALLGGDTVRTHGPLFLAITAFGEVAKGAALQRGKAQTGDDIYVSGSIGDAYLGLAMLRGEIPGAPFAIARYETPTPRLALGQALVETGVRSAVDISDGLLADIAHIAEASNLTAQLELAAMPFSSPPRDPLALLAGGDDYELAFTASPDKRSAMAKLATELGLPLTRIGSILPRAQKAIHLLNAAGQCIALPKLGFRHF